MPQISLERQIPPSCGTPQKVKRTGAPTSRPAVTSLLLSNRPAEILSRWVPVVAPSDPATLLSIRRFDRRVLAVGRHELASRRRTSSVLVAAVIGPIAVLLATGGDVHSVGVRGAADPAIATAAPCCMEVVVGGTGRRSEAAARCTDKHEFRPRPVHFGIQVSGGAARHRPPQLPDGGRARAMAYRSEPSWGGTASARCSPRFTRSAAFGRMPSGGTPTVWPST